MKPILFITSALLSVILFSCTTAYIPSELNTPAFHEENQFRGSISYGSSGTNLQLGYSFLDNFGAIGGISYLKTYGSAHRFQRVWEFGIGYFNRMENKGNPYYEVFAGFDIGETRSTYQDDGFEPNFPYDYEHSRYYKIFLQPDIFFIFDAVDLIFSMRLNYMNFSAYEHYSKPNAILPKAIGFEPAVTVRVGGENLKFKTQAGLSYTGRFSGSEFNYSEFFISFGLAFSF